MVPEFDPFPPSVARTTQESLWFHLFAVVSRNTGPLVAVVIDMRSFWVCVVLATVCCACTSDETEEPTPAMDCANPDATARGVEVGQFFPNLEVVDCDGQRVETDTLSCGASATLLSIGAGWCEPCREETPDLEALHQRLGAEGVRVVQIMFEDAAGSPATTLFCELWRDEFDLSLALYVDPVGRTLDHFDGASAPFNIFLDAEGRITEVVNGAVTAESLETSIARARE